MFSGVRTEVRIASTQSQVEGNDTVAEVGEATELHEKERIYEYPGGDKVVLQNVVELVVRPSGSHRLKTKEAEGKTKLHIMPVGWIHIEIDDSDWTV